MKKIFSFVAAALVAVAVSADPVVLPATLDVTNVSYRSEGMPDFVIEEGQDYAGTYFDMGAHDSANDTLLYAEWDVTIEPIKYNLAVDVYNTNSWRVQLYLLNQAGDTLKSLRYKGHSGEKGQFAIGALDLSDLEAGNYKVRAHAATAWSAMKLKDVIFAADYQGVSVALPGTLLPAYAELSAGATIANNAIAFAPSTAPDEYAIWNVTFAEAGDYNVTIDMTASNGHTYGVALLSADGESQIGAVAEAQAWDTGVKELGAINVPAAGSYKVKLTNATQWSEAVLNSIIFAAPAGTKYYMKNNWDGGSDWYWKEMTKADDPVDEYYLLENVVFGGTGVNVNTTELDEGAEWFPLENISVFDMQYEPAELGVLDTVVFIYTPGENLMSAIILGKYVNPIAEHTYTVAGSSSIVFGTEWDPTNTANDMILDNGVYTWAKAELVLAAGTISFKVVEDHSWNTAWPAQDYNLSIPETGIYTITITFDLGMGAVNAEALKTGDAEVLPVVLLHGNFGGGWADTEAFEAAEDKESASLILSLEAGTYEFGMKFDGAWKANGATITREASATSLAEGSGNMMIEADQAGDYLFTYTFASQTLTVTYPTTTALENANAAGKAQKMIENGQMVIMKNGVKYNVLGAFVK